MKLYDWKERAIMAFMLAFLAYMAIAAYGGWHKCKDAGGQYVRGVFWFTCVGGKP